MKKYRIISKTRFTIFVLIMIILTGSVLLGIKNTVTVNVTAAAKSEKITVMSGDTVWDIAVEYKPENMDIREAVDRICTANNMKAGDLQAGQELIIPVF